MATKKLKADEFQVCWDSSRNIGGLNTDGNLVRTIKAQQGKISFANIIHKGTYASTGVIQYKDGCYVIRRLSPKEVWNLFGFSSKDYQKASEVCSSTQLFKQAGNSIVLPVIKAIFQEML